MPKIFTNCVIDKNFEALFEISREVLGLPFERSFVWDSFQAPKIERNLEQHKQYEQNHPPNFQILENFYGVF